MDLMQTAQLLGNFGEFAGAIAVVITLLFLVIQIRQNTKQMRRLELNAAHQQFAVSRMAIATDREWAALVLKSATSVDELDPVDRLRINTWLLNQMQAHYHAWDRAREGTSEKDVWDVTVNGLKTTLGMAAFSRWWPRNRNSFIPKFRDEVDRMLEHGG